MANRTRSITQSNLLYVGPSPATGAHFSTPPSGGTNLLSQLHRVQSANFGANVTRTDINQFGQLDALDRIILEAPTVNLDFSYIVANALNADSLGFVTNGVQSMISGILAKEEDEKNYFLVTTREGTDAIGNAEAGSTMTTIGIGNGFISNFSAQGAVGGFPTENVTVEGLNIVSYLSNAGSSPAVIPINGTRVSNSPFTVPVSASTTGVVGMSSALRPGDITISINDPLFGPSIEDLKIQSYNISVPLSRESLNKLGSTFAFSKEIQFPITATASITAIVGNLVTGGLDTVICNDGSNNIDITLRKPVCGGVGTPAVIYSLRGAKLASQSYTTQIGQNQEVTLNYEVSIGAGSSSNGIFLSGVLV